jgi:hypothetical protein
VSVAKEIVEPLSTALPRLAHDVLAVEREEIERQKAHVAAVPVALLEDSLDAFVPVSGAQKRRSQEHRM